jgi:hypothetical protein
VGQRAIAEWDVEELTQAPRRRKEDAVVNRIFSRKIWDKKSSIPSKQLSPQPSNLSRSRYPNHLDTARSRSPRSYSEVSFPISPTKGTCCSEVILHALHGRQDRGGAWLRSCSRDRSQQPVAAPPPAPPPPRFSPVSRPKIAPTWQFWICTGHAELALLFFPLP